MTPIRRIESGQPFEITSRALGRAMFFPPIAAIVNIFLYVLGICVERHGIVLYGMVLMGNHYHILGLDTRGVLPEFVRDLNSLMARMLNVFWRRRDKVWGGAGYHIVRPINWEDLLARLIYIAANPAKAALVRHAGEFPGVVTLPKHVGQTQTVKRPGFFFSERSAWPETAEITIEVPAISGLARDEYVALFRRELMARESQHEAERRLTGKTVIGARALLGFGPQDTPRSEEPFAKQKFEIACKCREDRIAAIAELQAFRDEYRAAREEWLEAPGCVPFPRGTWWYVRYGGACAREAPS